MATPTIPEEWFPILTARLDAAQPTISLLRSYSNGNAPLPEMGKNTAATWLAFQRKARTNYGGIACQSHANRIRMRGVRVGSDDKSPASEALRRIARDNRLPMVIGDAVRNMLSARRGYLVAGVDGDGKALLTSEMPEQFYAEPDPVRPWRARAAVKVYRDTIAEVDYGLAWANGQRQWFTRPSRTVNGSQTTIPLSASGSDWTAGPIESYVGSMPVWIFDRADGMGLIEPHLDVIDRINLGKLQRLCITAMQAFRQRALKKEMDAELPEKDEAGNPINWKKVFEPAPGALWDLPEGIDIWESQPSDIRPLLDAEKADARDFAGVSGTPVSMLQPDSANQSATGAAATTAQQVDACQSDIDRIRLAVAACLVTALEIERVPFGGETIEADFENPAWVTLAEKMDAYSKAIAAGMSIGMAQKTYLGWSQEQIDEDERNRNRAAATAAMTAFAGQPKGAQPVSDAVAQSEDVKAKADAMGVLIRAGVEPDAAAMQVGLNGVKFRAGVMPASLVARDTANAGPPVG